MSTTQNRLASLIKSRLSDTDYSVQVQPDGEISVSRSVLLKVEQNADEESVKDVMVSWAHADEALGSALLNLVQQQQQVK